MRIIDQGHLYQLDHLDGDEYELLRFVKREGENYPGNVGHYEGTNIQEVLRALIHRIKYLDRQMHDDRNMHILHNLRHCIFLLESRAAERHNRILSQTNLPIEMLPYCKRCGHIECNGSCLEHK